MSSSAHWFEYGYGGMEERDLELILRRENCEEDEDISDGYGENDNGRFLGPVEEGCGVERLRRIRRKRARQGSVAGCSTSSGEEWNTVGEDDGAQNSGPSERAVPVNIAECCELPVTYGASAAAVDKTSLVVFGGIDASAQGVTSLCCLLSLDGEVGGGGLRTRRLPSERRTPSARCGHCMVSVPYRSLRRQTEEAIAGNSDSYVPTGIQGEDEGGVVQSDENTDSSFLVLFGGNLNASPQTVLDGIGSAKNDLWLGEVLRQTQITAESRQPLDTATATATLGEEDTGTAASTGTTRDGFGTTRDGFGTTSEAALIRWTPLEGVNLPSPRYGAAMAYVPTSCLEGGSAVAAMYVFGGHSGIARSTGAMLAVHLEGSEDLIEDGLLFGLRTSATDEGNTGTSGNVEGAVAVGSGGDFSLPAGDSIGFGATTNRRTPTGMLGDLVKLVLHRTSSDGAVTSQGADTAATSSVAPVDIAEGRAVDTIGSPPTARAGHSMVYCCRNKYDVDPALYVFGGLDDEGRTLAELHMLRLGASVWRDVALPYSFVVPARAFHLCVPTSRQTLVFIGGECEGVPVRCTWEYVPEDEEWLRLFFPTLALRQPTSVFLRRLRQTALCTEQRHAPAPPAGRHTHDVLATPPEESREKSTESKAPRTSTARGTSRAGSTGGSETGGLLSPRSPATSLATMGARDGSSSYFDSAPPTPRQGRVGRETGSAPRRISDNTAIFQSATENQNRSRYPFSVGHPSLPLQEPKVVDLTSAVPGTGVCGALVGRDCVVAVGGHVSSKSSLLHAPRSGLSFTAVHTDSSLKQQVALSFLLELMRSTVSISGGGPHGLEGK